MENLLSQWNISEDEKIIFRNEGLVLKKVDGKPALINPNIDLSTPFENMPINKQRKIKEYFENISFNDCTWESKPNYAIDKTSNNEELMKNGYAPFDENGNKYELHKIANDPNAPIAELHRNIHRGNEILKGNTVSITDSERKNYWINRQK